MTIKINKTGSLCPECCRFGVEENGICEYCGYNRYKVITTEKTEFMGDAVHKVFLNGTYIGFAHSENSAKDFGNEYINLCL